MMVSLSKEKKLNMKIQTQLSSKFIKLGELIEDMNVAMLTTTGAGGKLESRPMAPQEMDSEGAIWFLTANHSEKTKHLDHVNLSFVHPSHGTYVSLSGHATISVNREHIHRLWSAFAKPWFPDGPDSPNVVLFKFIPTGAEYWDAPHSGTVRLFAMAASIIAGKPVGMGEHETLEQL
jgi:general stress protein 26